MMLRRFTPLRPRKLMQRRMPRDPIPPAVRAYVKARDNGHCIGRLVGFPTQCMGPLEIDHVRASGGLGLKSPSEAWNLASLCALGCHRWKTEHGREARPLLIAYLNRVEARKLPESIW